MITCYLSLGSNLGDSAQHLRDALQLASAQAGRVTAVSPVYRTAAWGKTDQPDFLNIAAALQTALRADELMQQLLRIEQQLGREREEKWGPRIIDIDLLFYGNEKIDLPGLHVPHPEMQHRRFVLAPLNDIAASFVHPVLGKTIEELLEACSDQSPIAEEKLKIED